MARRGTARSETSRIEAIREAMDTEASRRQEATHRRLVEAHKQVYRVFNDVGKHVRESAGVSLIAVQHGFQGVRDTKRTLSWKAEGSDETVLSVTFDVREAGDELVTALSGEPVYRTSLASPRYEDPFDDALREVLTTRLFEAVTGRDWGTVLDAAGGTARRRRRASGARERDVRVSRYGRGRRRFTRRDALTREETTAEGENEVLTALDGELAGKSLREIGEYLCGAERGCRSSRVRRACCVRGRGGWF